MSPNKTILPTPDPYRLAYFPAQKSELHFFDRAKQHPLAGASLLSSV
jgi:hypothetical protein